MLAAAALTLSLVVRVYDNTGIAPAQRAAALTTARSILEGAGIAVTWRDGRENPDAGYGGGPPGGPPVPPEVIVRIVAAPTEVARGALGFSLIDVSRRSGTLATVFADRVAELAALAGVERGGLLGRAIAHEIGHLLLGTTRHARRGLMRETWTTLELQRDRPLDWALQRDDVVRMRGALVARARQSEQPDTVVAGRQPDFQAAEP